MKPVLLIALPLLMVGCGVTPITNKIKPGEEPFVVAVGEGPDGATDLFAAETGGGPFFRLTFSRPAEWAPRIAPSGAEVAYVRARQERDSTNMELVIYDLIAGTERRGPIPHAAGPVRRLGWNRAGDSVFAAADQILVTAADRIDFHDVPPALAGEADSSLMELLGTPAQGRVTHCGAEVCIVSAGGDTTALGPDVTDAIRWGPDSVALIRGSELEVRPLLGGRPRLPRWTDVPKGFRTPSYHPGEDASGR